MKAVIVLPTWLLIMACRWKFPAGHPFKRWIPLQEWAARATPFTVEYGIVLWALSLPLIVSAWVLLH